MKMIPFVAQTIREDNQRASCVILLPKEYRNVDEFDDSYDDLISEQIEDKIYFEGLGYTIAEIKELNKYGEKTK